MILVVDDEPSIRELIAEVLESAGYDIQQADNGQAALEHVRGAHPPDLVITDIFMPGMDGLELIETLRSTRRSRPLIAISGGGGAEVGPTLAMARERGPA